MANRYWVGTTGNWSDTANWSDTSGGTGGLSVPTNADDVFFDANSGSGTVTVDISSECDDLTFTGFTGTFAGSSALGIYGSLVMGAGMTRTYAGSITFRATTTGKTLTFNGITTASNVTFNGDGGAWTLQDAWNNGSGTITLTTGTLDTNDQTVTCGIFSSSNTNTRTLDLGSSTINVLSWSFSTTTNLTFTAGTSTIASGGSFLGGGLTYNVVTITSTSSVSRFITGANTFATLTITGPSNKTQSISLSESQTITGTLTIAGNSATNRLLVRSSTIGTARTITAATTTLSNVDFRDITGAGAGSWSGTSIGDALGNSGITFTTPTTRYAVAAGNWSDTATWATSSGGSAGASVPLCHDDVVLDANSGVGTITVDMPRLGADITCTNYTGTLALDSASVFGSFALGTGLTVTSSEFDDFYFSGRSSHTINMAGKPVAMSFLIDAVAGTYTLAGNVSIVATSTNQGAISLLSGTLNFDSYDVTCQAMTFGGVRDNTLNLGSGTLSLYGLNTIFAPSTSMTTINAGTSTIDLTNTSSTNKTFSGSGKTYNTLRLSGAGTGSYTITGSNTFATLESTKTNAYSILFDASTQTIGTWGISGSAGNVVTLTSLTTSTYTLTKSGGGDVVADYLAIQHCIATPSYTWYAGNNSTDNQSVATAGSGWIFNDGLPTVSTEAVSSVADTTATGNATIVDGGASTVTRRGVVVGTISQADPGDVAPASSGYALDFGTNGAHTTGAFTESLTGLTAGTTYYARGYALNTAGYAYGDEVTFTTDGLAIITVTNATTAAANVTNADAPGASAIINGTTSSTTITNL